MDASASPKPDANFKEVYDFFLKIENTDLSTPTRQRNTVIKYTKLPNYDFDSKLSWPQHSYMLQPRLRRIIAFDESDMKSKSTRSMKPELEVIPKMTSASLSKRKIVTISEDDESDLHPKFTKDRSKSSTAKTSHRSISADFKDEKTSQRTTSRLTNSTKYSKETRTSAKSNIFINKKETSTPKPNYIGKYSNISNLSDSVRARNIQDNESSRGSNKSVASSRTNVSKTHVTPSESEIEISMIKSKLMDKFRNISTSKRPLERSKSNRTTSDLSGSKVSLLKTSQNKYKPTVIHVPIDDKCHRKRPEAEAQAPPTRDAQLAHSAPDMPPVACRDTGVGTERIPHVDKPTEMDSFQLETVCQCVNTGIQTAVIRETFDSLDIPNVSLTQNKSESKSDVLNFHSQSLPNLRVPELKVTSNREENNSNDSNFRQSSSYIISQATLTYTTKQKINFHVVDSNDDSSSNQSPSPLSYPINVVSVLKKEMRSRNVSESGEDRGEERPDRPNELNSLAIPNGLNSNKLMKPSDIISTIRVNNGLLQREFICEQFQRELNFIDSFFESLQYLESCSLSEGEGPRPRPALMDASFGGASVYRTFLSNIENGATVDDTETMASKSLCLLNLLIRDEQRRAKNLLFVLKMREDALKDFTKSQILWLEKKKKQDNTDISTLKKKQRGALLKWQHECGEMQRMRKALVTLSEKRKVALMKTKKNIELNLKNNVDVEQMLLGKKKVKRNMSDRNASPLKCFDLSSSGCEDATSRVSEPEPAPSVAEKCVQTNESVEEITVDSSTNTAAENFVVVDGGYLNILFSNMSFPEMFSGGKQYEVNEEALRNVLSSSNYRRCYSNSDTIEKFMHQVKDRDDKSSSPSTARSLVDEFDQYYQGLGDEKSHTEEESPAGEVYELHETTLEPVTVDRFQSLSTVTFEDCANYDKVDTVEKACGCDLRFEEDTSVVVGPLPVPTGALAPAAPPVVADEAVPFGLQPQPSVTSSSSECSSVSSQPCEGVSSVSSLTSPVLEAEELRRQQLAIEKEIKALEQQQSRLLVVREIPDKPPPPYTPPAEARAPAAPPKFELDDETERKIQEYVCDGTSQFENSSSFDVFVKDLCKELLDRQKQETSDRPWDACNQLPQKPSVEPEKLAKKSVSDVAEVLADVPPTAASGVSSRRSDHVDDILYAEWRRCEPEWSTLHAEEAVAKNQIFESIFQRILTETVDQYKKTVQCDSVFD